MQEEKCVWKVSVIIQAVQLLPRLKQMGGWHLEGGITLSQRAVTRTVCTWFLKGTRSSHGSHKLLIMFLLHFQDHVTAIILTSFYVFMLT